MKSKRSDTPLSKAKRRKVGQLDRAQEARLKAALTQGGPATASSRLTDQGAAPVNAAAAKGASGRLRPR